MTDATIDLARTTPKTREATMAGNATPELTIGSKVETPEEIIALAKLIRRFPAATIYEMAEAHPAGSQMRATMLKMAAIQARNPIARS